MERSPKTPKFATSQRRLARHYAARRRIVIVRILFGLAVAISTTALLLYRTESNLTPAQQQARGDQILLLFGRVGAIAYCAWVTSSLYRLRKEEAANSSSET